MVDPRLQRPPGRPRSEEKRRAILEATIELLETRGFTGFSVDAIASAAGVGKATVYRWWPNKAAVTMDAVLSIVDPAIPHPGTGSAYEDLRRHLRVAIRLHRGARTAPMIAAVYAEALHDPELAAAVNERVQIPRREAAKQILRDGIARGELRDDLELDTTLDILYGPLYYRFLVTHAPMSPRDADRLLDRLWPVLASR